MVQTAMLIVSGCFWLVCCAIFIRLVPQITPHAASPTRISLIIGLDLAQGRHDFGTRGYTQSAARYGNKPRDGVERWALTQQTEMTSLWRR